MHPRIENIPPLPLQKQLPELSPEACSLAARLLSETESPQPLEGTENISDTDGTVIDRDATRQLQSILLDAHACSARASECGVELTAYARPPVPGTPTGDFYDVIALRDGRLSIFLGDAVGHNNPDAWHNSVRFGLFIRSKVFLDNVYCGSPTAKGVIDYIDQYCNFRGSSSTDAVVVSHILLDPVSGAFEFANAGNPHDLVIIRADGEVDSFRAEGGLVAHPEMPVTYLTSEPDQVFGTLAPGDIAVMLTDGIQDGVHISGRPMGQVLASIFKTLAARKPTPEEVITTVLSELAGTPDDLAIVTFRSAASLPARDRTVGEIV